MKSLPQVQRAVQHAFAEVPGVNIQRSSFNRNHGWKGAFDSGYLIPCFVDEVLPGDTHSLKMTHFARLATPIVPVMDNLYLDTFFFYVPLRLLWTNFKKFMGEQKNPADSISYVNPVVTTPAAGYAVGSLADYYGLPTLVPGMANVSAFPFRAYNLIWNEWFRDENLQNSLTENVGDGPDTDTDYTVKRRGKRHDYFTSCLPWTQKGTAVTLPLGTSAPVYGPGNVTATTNQAVFQGYNSTDAATQYGGLKKVAADLTLQTNSWTGLVSGDTMGNINLGTAAQYSSMGSAYSPPFADLTNATAATINALRLAFQTQAFLERDARGGSRYTEIVRSHFGVISPDARLQRPELLAVNSTRINFHPVQQTSPTSGSNALGQLAAFAVTSNTNPGFTKSFTEHGIIIGLCQVRADLNYQRGINKMWSRSTRYDYYWPTFANLGEQAVLNQEIYAQGTAGAGADSNTFGYQERYAEYRYKPSVITGKFNSHAASTIDVWHLAQKFTALPTLGDTFIQDTPPVSRVVALSSEPQILMDAYFELTSARPMPMFSVPSTLGNRF